MTATIRVRRALIVLAAIAIAIVLVGGAELPIGCSIAALAVPPVVWLVLTRSEREGNRVDSSLVAVLVGALLLLAVALPPSGSRDVWSYVMYGRTLVVHGVSPYTHVPASFPHDPFLSRVGSGWRHTPSVYGPVFVGIAGVGSRIAGESALAARLYHQILEAGAVTLALVIVWRRTRSPAALALLGINPITIVSVVNGGHNDGLVGLLVLGATVLVLDERFATAGAALGVAALIKVTALLALPALIVWAAIRFGRRAAHAVGWVAFGAVAVGYAAVGPSAITALSSNRKLMSRSTPWQLPRALVRAGSGGFAGMSSTTWMGILSTASFVVVGGLVLAIAWRMRHEHSPTEAVVLGLAAFVVAGVYVLPWYVAWLLPVACLSDRLRLRRFVAVLCTALPIVYAVKARALPHSVGPVWWFLGAYVAPLLILAWYLVLAFARSAPAPAREPRARPTHQEPKRLR